MLGRSEVVLQFDFRQVEKPRKISRYARNDRLCFVVIPNAERDLAKLNHDPVAALA